MQLTVIAHDIRSAHNVGALLRTADGFGAKVILTGYTPYPAITDDKRLPHITQRLAKQIHKTALGAETDHSLWRQEENVQEVIQNLKRQGFSIVALEQAQDAIPLPDFKPTDKTAILLGREVEGIDPELLALCDKVLEIPMQGRKESFNVTEAATAAMYHCRFAK